MITSKKAGLRSVIAAILLIAMLLTSFCACKNTDDKSPDGDEGNNTDGGTENGGGDGNESGGSTDDGTENEGGDGNESGGSTGDNTENNNDSNEKIDYTVKIQSKGGLPLSGINIYVYKGEDDLVTYGRTDDTGVATVSMARGDDYNVQLAGVPEGYEVSKSYPFDGTSANITLTSSVISDASLTNVKYELGSVMHDFTVVTSDDETIKLSDVLKEKDMVLINFWYVNCSWCVKEFPYMNSAYEKFSDEVEIIALNPYADDDELDVKLFKSSYELSFPMAKDYTGITKNALELEGYPTSIFVDRYGVICLIEAGGIVSEEPFTAAFTHFTADNYVQTLFEDISELTPVETPTVDMPSSDEIGAVINKGDIEITYSPEDDEFSWPFVIGDKDGTACIVSSNKNKTGSYAILNTKVKLKEGDVLAFDYFASTELGADILYVIVDGNDTYTISGVGSSWETCHAYVALADGEYEVSLCYIKDSSTNEGEDSIYIKDMRVISKAEISSPTYIYREASTNPNEDGFGYQNYVTVVYNETDGYYHVGSKNGPLLLANLMGYTHFSSTDSVYTYAYNGKVVIDGKNYYEDIVDFCSYASNSEISGLCTVNEELRELLETVSKAVGLEPDNPDAWLQMCVYYDAYGTNGKQLDDPIRGLANFSAIPAKEGKDNTVTYNRVIMPRGLKYKFVPSKSGVYRITSDSQYEVNAWIFLEDGSTYVEYEHAERMYTDTLNCSMVAYLKAGESYYIDIAFYDVYQEGTFTFEVKYIAKTYELFRLASPGYFTYYESTTGAVNEIIAGGIDVKLGSDGYYHELREDGTLGSKLYADFSEITPIFSHSILELIELGAFNFTLSEDDQTLKTFFAQYGDNTIDKLKEIWGESYEEYYELYQVEDFMNNIYHGTGEDMTSVARKYAEKIITSGEKKGCVEVNEELANLLQLLMDKYTFEGVDHSWTKICYYYQYFG